MARTTTTTTDSDPKETEMAQQQQTSTTADLMAESTTTTGRSYCAQHRSTYSSEGDCGQCATTPAFDPAPPTGQQCGHLRYDAVMCLDCGADRLDALPAQVVPWLSDPDEARRLYVRGLLTLAEVAQVVPFVCMRAIERGDCPVGHEWGDPGVRLAVHYGARAHADALAWAATEAERELVAVRLAAEAARVAADLALPDDTEPECCRQAGYVKAGTDGVARCGTCWDDLAAEEDPGAMVETRFVETVAERNRAAMHALDQGTAAPADFAGIARWDFVNPPCWECGQATGQRHNDGCELGGDCEHCGARFMVNEPVAEVVRMADGQSSLNTAAGDEDWQHLLVHAEPCAQAAGYVLA